MIELINQLLKDKNPKSFYKILSKHSDILDWIDQQTKSYSPSTISEKLYILLKSPPIIRTCGKYPLFNTFEKGYRLSCGNKTVCGCARQEQSEKMFEYNTSLSNEQKQAISTKTKHTNLKKYGVSNVAQNKKIKEKIQKTNQKRYGANSPLESKEIQEKIQNTNLKKYGVKYPLQNQNIQHKSHQTAIKKYGDDYMQIARNAFLEKNNFQNPFVVHKEKIKNSLLKKYNVDHPLKKDDIYKKSQKTLKHNHGVYNPAQLHIPVKSYEIIEDKIQFKILCETYSLKELTSILNVSESIIWNRHNKYELDIYSKKSRSQYEEEIAFWLDGQNINYQRNYKINSKTVDFLINNNVAIEFNGLYIHSENSVYGKKLKIDHKYHWRKFINCRDQNIKLFTIFEDEWNDRKEIIKNKILVLLNRADKGIGARKLTISPITSTQAIKFLNQYHLQGGIYSSVYLGAFENKELVSVMTFIKRNNNQYELNRFASDFKIHSGLFSRMIKYFENNYDFNFIYSFSDNRWSWGDVYKNNGFEFNSSIKPDYFVTNYQLREHKFNWRKSRIKSRFNIDISNKTEIELIRELKWDRIWDCGKVKWIRIKK